jgi:phenylacetate-CoA ligase
MPLTTKQQLIDDQRDNPPYGTNLTYPIENYTRYSQTSATTAQTMRWLDTPQSWQWMLDNWKQVFSAAGVAHGDRIFFAFSFGPFLGFWTAFEAASQMQCLCIPGGGMSSSARLRTIIENQATALCCTPTYALRLGQVAQEENIDLNDAAVRVIIVAGEPGGSIPATRAAIEKAWPGARVFDHHGMTEIGPVTYECADQPNCLQIIDSSYLAEVIDPTTGIPAYTGELILTTLGRAASPLLRYRTGDLVTRNSEGILVGGILGRADDMVLVRGVNLYPSAVDQVIHLIPGIAEYRVHVDNSQSMAQVSLTIEPIDVNGAEDLQAQVIQAMRDAFNLRIDVTTAAPNELPRFEMKAMRWVRS